MCQIVFNRIRSTRAFNLLFAIGLSTLFCSSALAQKDFNLNDCIIEGMKGVASDAAAKLVKEACERKDQEQPDWRVRQYRKDLGRVVSVDLLRITNLSTEAEPGFHSMTVKNEDPSSTVTFIRIKATPAPVAGKGCDFLKTRFEVFRVSIPPGASQKLLYPNRGGEESCVALTTVFARAPSPSDAALPVEVKALPRDPLTLDPK